MNDNLDGLSKAVDSLSEQKRKLDIALHYTHNDMDKAKNMAAGIYKDMYVIKGKFSASTTYGAFLAFFNIPYCTLMNSFVIMSHSYIVDDLKTVNGWRVFEEEMEGISNEGGHDSELTSKIKLELAQAFTLQIGVNQRANELKKYLEMNDEISANRVVQKFIADKLGFTNINLSVDYEQISSLDMELYSKTSDKLNGEALQDKGKKKDESAEGEEEETVIDKKDIQLILRGNLVLSPMKGKNISLVEVGDRIKLNLDTANPKALTVLKAFKAYNDGKTTPITGRVVSIKHLVNGGYKVYCIIAKGIYVKVEEEEEGIRVAVDSPGDAGTHETPKAPLLIALIIIFIVLVAVAVGLVLL